MVELNARGNDKNQNELVFTGLSSDEKPTEWKGAGIAQMSVFFEIDTGDVYMYDGEHKTWLPL